MKYNYIISIFLLIFVVIISQTIYIYSNKKKWIEGWRGWRRNNNNVVEFDWAAHYRRIAEEAAAAARVRYLALLGQFTDSRQSKYVNVLGKIYVDNQTGENLAAFNQAKQVDELKNQTSDCKNDADIGKMMLLTSNILNSNAQNSTKVYFISEILLKAFGPFYGYNKTNNESQQNYLNVNYPKTFKDDESIKKKYFKLISLLSLAQVSKSTTSSSLNPVGNYFKAISSPIIEEAKKIVNEIKNINYSLSDEEKNVIQNKYSIIVK